MKICLSSFIAVSIALSAAEPENGISCCEEEPAPGPDGHKLETTAAARGSLHDFDHTWTDQSANPFRLASLAGKTVVVTMGYTTCKFACPRLMADLMAIERGLTSAEKAATRFVFITIDPDADTSASLAEFLKTYQVDPLRWHALRGGPAETREISVALGVRFRSIGAGDFAHSNIITLLGPDGAVIHRQEGLGGDPAGLIGSLRRSLEKPPAP